MRFILNVCDFCCGSGRFFSGSSKTPQKQARAAEKKVCVCGEQF
jgi:hypothetical protein